MIVDEHGASLNMNNVSERQPWIKFMAVMYYITMNAFISAL